MTRKVKLTVLITVALVFIAGLIFIILVGTNAKLDKQELVTYKDLRDFKSKKLDNAFKKIIDETDREVEINFDEKELNELVALVFREYEQKHSALKISGYQCRIDKDRIEVSFDSYLFKLLPVQYIFEIIPSIENNQLSFFVANAKIGKLSITAENVLKKLKTTEKNEYYVDLQKRSIVLNNKYPYQIIFKRVEVKEGKVGVQIALSINSVKDLVNVLGLVLPEDLEALIEKLPVDEIKDIAAETIKEIALSQISGISNYIKDEAVSSLTNYAKNNIKLDKLKDIFSKDKVDAIIKKAGEVVSANDKELGVKEAGDKKEADEVAAEDKANAGMGNETIGRDEPGVGGTLKQNIVDGVKKQLEMQDEDSKLGILKKLLD